MPSLSRTFSLFLLAVLVAVGASGCSDGRASSDDESGPAQRSAARVEVLRLAPTSFEDVIELTGTVEALSDARLSAQASGTVTTLVDRGTRLSTGQRVAQIDPDEERAAMEQTKAQYELAKDRLERQRPLYRDSIISAIEFEQIRSEFNRAKAAYEEAQQRLKKTRVTTPFAGTVEERFVEQGEQVAPGTPVARVVNTQRVRISAGVPERYANDIVPGSRVRVDFRRYGGEVRTAPVTFVGNAINPDTRTFPIEVEVDNPNGRLKPEMVPRIAVTRAQLDSALVIPRTAIVRDEMGTHAYVAVETDTAVVAEKRSIVLGPKYGERAVILSGVARGEDVVVAGQNDLAPGDPVRVTTTYDRLPNAGTPFEGTETAGLPTPDGSNDGNRRAPDRSE